MSTLAVRIADLITAIGTDIKQHTTWITGSSNGNLSGLTTTAKGSVVAAINEVNAKPTGGSAASDAQALAMASSSVNLVPSNLAAITNVANGLVKLDGAGKVGSAQLPSYVDDVLEYANQAAFPGTGTAGLIYVTQDTNKTYRWTGSAYVEISASPGSTDAVTEGSTNLYFTSARADARVTALAGNTDTDLVALYNTAKA